MTAAQRRRLARRAVAVKERPIIFSGPMVRAILAGTKTQTRRVVKVRGLDFVGGGPKDGQDWNDPSCWGFEDANTGRQWALAAADDVDDVFPCPYGAPGDRLWVREAWDFLPDEGTRGCLIRYWADAAHEYYTAPPGFNPLIYGKERVRPSFHLPRWASRITLEIVGVRVQRAQEISANDIIAEGAVARAHDDQFGHNPVSAFDGRVYLDLRSLWASGWDSLNAKRGFCWASNPWVWTITFSRVSA